MAQDEVHHLTERLSKTTWMADLRGRLPRHHRRSSAPAAPSATSCRSLALIFIAYALAGPNLPMGHRAPRLFPRAYLQVPRYRPGRSVRHDHERFRHGHLHVRYVRRVPRGCPAAPTSSTTSPFPSPVRSSPAPRCQRGRRLRPDGLHQRLRRRQRRRHRHVHHSSDEVPRLQARSLPAALRPLPPPAVRSCPLSWAPARS